MAFHSTQANRVKVHELHSPSVTAAAQRHHVVILLQNHVLLIIEVQQTDGLEPVGDTAGGSHFVTRELERVHDGAHRGVVGGSEAPSQWERAGTLAVVGIVTPGRDDPARPADLLEVNKEWNPLAGLGGAVGQESWRCTSSPAAVLVVLRCCCCRLGLSCGKIVLRILSILFSGLFLIFAAQKHEFV